MPDSQAIIGLPGFKIIKVTHQNPLIFELYCEISPLCPHCGGRQIRIKDTFLRKLRHESFGTRLSQLVIKTHKYHCQKCLRYFNQRLPGVMPYARSTEPFKREVCSKHEQGVSQRTLQQELCIGNATVERWYQRSVVKMREVALRLCPQILGIDAHFFIRKKGYATTFVDLKLHRVFDVVLGRSEASLKTFLEKLEGRDRVKVVVMDLSETYRSIIKKYFPNAMIVADRFHVIRLINHHFLKAWQHFDEVGRKNRGLLSLMRRHRWNLSEMQMEKLDQYLFKELPVIGAIYEFKQQLCQFMLFKSLTARDVRPICKAFSSEAFGA